MAGLVRCGAFYLGKKATPQLAAGARAPRRLLAYTLFFVFPSPSLSQRAWHVGGRLVVGADAARSDGGQEGEGAEDAHEFFCVSQPEREREKKE
jgi:hypothetical protein